ncbi:MAG: EamA family transporter [Thermoleophilia bacterium]|nr:EamA family transporter [Thermoleophilia bacterium]
MSVPGAHPRQAALLVLATALSVQAGSAVATRLFTLVDPAGATALRALGAAAIMLVAAGGPRSLRRVPREAMGTITGLGLSAAAMNLCFYEAISRIPLGAAVTVEFLGPIALAAVTTHRRSDVGWAMTALAGVALVSGGLDGDAGAVGVGFALAAGAMWATYLTFARRLGHGGTGLAGLATALVVAAAVTAPILLVSHPAAHDVPQALLLGLTVGALSNALGFALEIQALRRASLTVVGVLLSVEPAIAAIIGFVALDQGLTPVQAGGIALVVAAGAGVVRGSGGGAAPVDPGG